MKHFILAFLIYTPFLYAFNDTVKKENFSFDAHGYTRLGTTYDDSREDKWKPEFRLRILPIMTYKVDSDTNIGASLQYQVDENFDGEIDFENAQTSVPYAFFTHKKWFGAFGNTDGAFGKMPLRAGFEPGVTFPFNQSSAINFRRARKSWSGMSSGVLYLGYGGRRDRYQIGASVTTDDKVLTRQGFDTFDEESSVMASIKGKDYTMSMAYADGYDNQSLLVGLINVRTGPFSITTLLADDNVSDDKKSGLAYGMSARYEVVDATYLDLMLSDGEAEEDVSIIGVGATYRFNNGINFKTGIFEHKSKTSDKIFFDAGFIYFY